MLLAVHLPLGKMFSPTTDMWVCALTHCFQLSRQYPSAADFYLFSHLCYSESSTKKKKYLHSPCKISEQQTKKEKKVHIQ